MASIPAAKQVNLFVVKGSQFTQRLYYYESESITVHTSAEAGDASVKISPLCEAIAASSVVDWDVCESQPYRSVTSGTTALGADSGQRYRTLAISGNVAFPLAKGTVGRIAPDLSTRTFSGQIRSDQVSSAGVWGDGTLVYTLASINLDEGTTDTRGLLQVTIPTATTGALDITVTPSVLGNLSVEQWRERRLPLVQYGDRSHYTYSIEEVVSGERLQRVFGVIAVGADSTLAS